MQLKLNTTMPDTKSVLNSTASGALLLQKSDRHGRGVKNAVVWRYFFSAVILEGVLALFLSAGQAALDSSALRRIHGRGEGGKKRHILDGVNQA